MDNIGKYFFTWFIKPILSFYLKRETSYYYKGLRIRVFPGVFHPQFFFSSKFLANFVEGLPLSGKTFFEPCSGSGFISLISSRNKAIVTASDINPNAVDNIKLNYKNNASQLSSENISVHLSDVFDAIPAQQFDYIVVNPPYFFKDYTNLAQAAWNCGLNGTFFDNFFSKLVAYTHTNSEVFMVLADNCDIERIKKIASSYFFDFVLVKEKKILWEKNYIFKIVRQKNE